MILIHINVKKKHLHCWVISHVYIFVFYQYMLYIVDMNKKYIKYIDYIVSDIELPYIKSIEPYGLSEKEYPLVLSKVFNQPVTIKRRYVYDTNGNTIYWENSSGFWEKREYDTNGKLIYREDSNGYWAKYVYDQNGNRIYYENSDGYWAKYEYDTNGKLIYFEKNNGFWVKYEYDTNGKLLYREDSDGYIEDNR